MKTKIEIKMNKIVYITLLIVETSICLSVKKLKDYPCNFRDCSGENESCRLMESICLSTNCLMSPVCVVDVKPSFLKCPIGEPIIDVKSREIRCSDYRKCPVNSHCLYTRSGLDNNMTVCCWESFNKLVKPIHHKKYPSFDTQLSAWKGPIRHKVNTSLVNFKATQKPNNVPKSEKTKFIEIIQNAILDSKPAKKEQNITKYLKDFDAGKISVAFLSKTSASNGDFRRSSKSVLTQKYTAVNEINKMEFDDKHKDKKYRFRREPNGYYDAIHPSVQGIDVPLIKPGECSRIKRGKWFSGCMDTCFNDADCYSNLKCCDNGCARSCQYPVATFNLNVPAKKPGRCPRLTSLGLTGCTGAYCTLDTDCVGHDKCCNSGNCGRMCQHPVPSSPFW